MLATYVGGVAAASSWAKDVLHCTCAVADSRHSTGMVQPKLPRSVSVTTSTVGPPYIRV